MCWNYWFAYGWDLSPLVAAPGSGPPFQGWTWGHQEDPAGNSLGTIYYLFLCTKMWASLSKNRFSPSLHHLCFWAAQTHHPLPSFMPCLSTCSGFKVNLELSGASKDQWEAISVELKHICWDKIFKDEWDRCSSQGLVHEAPWPKDCPASSAFSVLLSCSYSSFGKYLQASGGWKYSFHC